MPWGVAAAGIAAAGTVGAAALSSGNNKTGTQTSQQSIPAWLQQPTQANLDASQALSQKGYQGFQGQLVAPFSPDQTSGMDFLRNNATNFSPYIQNAQNLVQGGAGGIGDLYQPQQFTAQGVGTPSWSQDALNQYQSPYTQSVIDPMVKQMQGQFQQQNMQTADQAKMAGAFGGDRQGIEQSQNQYFQNMAMNNAIAPLRQAGYQNAQQQFNADAARNQQGQMFNSQSGLLAQSMGNQSQQFGAQLTQADLQRQLQAGQMEGSLGSLQQGLTNQAGQNIYGIGAAQQQQAQNVLGSNYGQYQQQQQWPYQQQQFLSGIIHGSPAPLGITASQYQNPNQAAQIAGTVGLAGLMGGQIFNQYQNATAGTNAYNTGMDNVQTMNDFSNMADSFAFGPFAGGGGGYADGGIVDLLNAQ